MDVNERLALEIGKPALRAALAEAQVENLAAQIRQKDQVLTEAADEIEALRIRVAFLEAESDRAGDEPDEAEHRDSAE